MKKKLTAFLLMLVMVLSVMGGTTLAFGATTNLVDTYTPFNKSSSFKDFPTSGDDVLSMGGKKYKNAFVLDFYATDGTASYNIEGQYTTLTGIAGVPEKYSVGTTMNIYGDNALLTTMDIRPDQLPQSFSVNVSGVSNLKFEVLETDADINGFYTYIGFAELGLHTDSPSSPTSNATYAPSTASASAGNLVDTYTPFNKSGSFKDFPTSGSDVLSMGGKKYKNAFVLDFYATDGTASYNIEGKYTTLTGIAGVPEKYSVGTTVNIYGDNALLTTMDIRADQLPQSFSLNVSGVSNLKFEVLETDANINGFYTYIGFAELTLYGGTPSISTPTPPPTPTPNPTPTPTYTPTPTPTPSTGTNPSGFDLEAIAVGVKLKWQRLSGGMGYRLYRSQSASNEGISVTDFYITSNEFVDVNVDSNTTYYYTVRQVLAEARPFEGIPEKLGPASGQIKVTTGSEILGGNGSDSTSPKQFILMTLDDPYMSVNGVREEIDPGRGTTPLILNSRTMVPIRAIVEAMNGTVNWNESAKRITLNHKAQTVIMTLNDKNISVNGSSKAIDVPPTSINSRTMVPIRFAAENLGCQVDWINSTRQIVIVFR